jgi:hypothetical protein
VIDAQLGRDKSANASLSEGYAQPELVCVGGRCSQICDTADKSLALSVRQTCAMRAGVVVSEKTQRSLIFVFYRFFFSVWCFGVC